MKKLSCQLMMAAVLFAHLRADVINVPVDRPTIQAGIDAAVNGDTVLVADGTYTGAGNRDIDFGGKNVVLKSTSGAEDAIIDCGGSASEPHRGLYFHSGEDTTAVVDGFTIRKAFLIGADTTSGAIYCLGGASPTIRNCHIIYNQCNGVRSVGSAPTNPRLDNCIIANNAGHGVSAGGQVWPIGRVRVSNSLIKGNSKTGLRIGYALGETYIINCTVVSNDEGGILLLGDLPKAEPQQSETTYVSNNIVAFNGDFGIKKIADFWRLLLLCNDSYGNPGGDWVSTPASPGDMNGNISLDPFFCDVSSHNYCLAESSPCAPVNNNCGLLIGKYGVGCTNQFICGDINENGIVNIADVVLFIHCIFTIDCWLFGIPPGIDVNCSGRENISDVVYLIMYIFNGGPPPCDQNNDAIPNCYGCST